MPRSHLARLGLAGPATAPTLEEGGDGHGYPRPQLRRAEWTSLNGVWEFALDTDARWTLPSEVVWDKTILVPFAPECARSGVADTGFHKAFWYRRLFDVSGRKEGERVVLHFGAVDYAATVWIDGILASRHEGGYTPFELDATDLLTGDGPHEVLVRAEDDPSDLAKPRGKQDWQLEPHSIWYPRTSGIWQTVWMERVPARRIIALRWTANLERWEIGLEAHVRASAGSRLRLEVKLSVGNLVLAHDSYSVVAGEVHRRIALSDPGIDDFRNELLWSPTSPTLIDAEVTLIEEDGTSIDAVVSYTALRSVSVQGSRIILNGRPLALRMVLDQGYWVETGLTPPSDGALRRDVELTKEMGFNGSRKHQKIEDPRFLYWADKLGLVVWEEMPSAYRFTKRSVERVTREWLEVVGRDVSHPCIVAWVPFNESWGVPNLPDNAPERHYVEGLYHLTKTIDATRPVVGNDGWESVATDIIGIHDYDSDTQRMRSRYLTESVLARALTKERPGGKAIILDVLYNAEHPIVLSEFGGISYAADPEGTWGYSRCQSPEELAARYGALLEVVSSLRLLAGYCYTQFADTFQETNGLLYADRRPKFPLEQMAAFAGKRPPGDPVLEPDPEPSTTERFGAPT